MLKEKINVTVSGVCGSGKFRMAFLLKKLMRENGFEVQYKNNSNFMGETDFDESMQHNFEDAIYDIKCNKIIVIETNQLKAEEIR